MKRVIELVEMIDSPAVMLARLDAFIERRNERANAASIVDDLDIPAELQLYAVGQPYGRYSETIVRRDVTRGGWPKWFDPRNGPGQFGIAHGDFRVYIQVRVDNEARSQPSTFDDKLMGLVVATPQQGSLF